MCGMDGPAISQLYRCSVDAGAIKLKVVTGVSRVIRLL